MYMNIVSSTVDVPYTTFPPLLEKMYVLMSDKLKDILEKWWKMNEYSGRI